MKRAWWKWPAMAAAIALAVARPFAEDQETEVLLSRMTQADEWIISASPGSDPGRSSLSVHRTDGPEAEEDALLLRVNLDEGSSGYVALNGTLPIRYLRCTAIHLQARSEDAPCPIGLVLSDTEGHWFESPTVEPASGKWERLSWRLDEGALRPLLRIGEEPAPVRPPLTLRQIRCYAPQGPASPSERRIWLGRLHASVVPSAMDALDARISTGRAGNIFWGEERAELTLTFHRRAAIPFVGTGVLEVEPFTGPAEKLDLGTISVPGGGSLTRRVQLPSRRFGYHEVRLTVRASGIERTWLGSFGRIRSASLRSIGRTFGACGNVEGFSGEAARTAARLSRAAGISWTRMGIAWDQVNPAPGLWYWQPPEHTPGPAGKALRTAGRPLAAGPWTLPREEITIAFWVRAWGPTGRTQWALAHSDRLGRRSCGIALARETGRFLFAAAFEREPDAVLSWDSGVSLWDGRWRHVAVTYSSHIRQVSLYVDGKAMTTAEHDGGPLRALQGDLRLGVGAPMDVDELLLYGRALGPADIAALARRSAPPRDGLVGWWSFDADTTSRAPASAAPAFAPEEPDAVGWMDRATRDGLEPVVILGFPPAWAASGYDAATGQATGNTPEPRLWARYVEGVVRRFRDRVRAWEIWHEPNSPAYWSPAPDPAAYVRTLAAAYEAAKRANPRCLVVMPGLAGPDPEGNGMPYLERLLRLGAARYCDAISLHPVPGEEPERTGFVQQLRRAAGATEGGRGKSVWLTELGISTEVPGGVSERKQAALLARTYVLALSSGVVERIAWYRFHDSGPDRTLPEDNQGLCRADLTPKPAFYAHRTLAVLLDGARPVSSGTPARDVRAVQFLSGGEHLTALWSTGQTRTVAVQTGSPRLAVTDLMGNPTFPPTQEGVSIVEAGELMTFLRGMPPAPRWLGEPLRAEVSRGEDGTWTVTVTARNPFPSARNVRLTFRAEAAARKSVPVEPSSAELSLAPGALGSVQRRLRMPDGTDASGRLTVRGVFLRPGAPADQAIPVEIRAPVGMAKAGSRQP